MLVFIIIIINMYLIIFNELNIILRTIDTGNCISIKYTNIKLKGRVYKNGSVDVIYNYP